MRSRNVHVQLWLNQKEADALARSAKKCGLTQSTYLRHLITGFVPKELPPPKRLAASASMLVVTMLKQIKKATRNFFMVVGHLVVEKIRRRA